MASMGFFAKISMGVLFGLLQEFAPEKTRYDKSLYNSKVEMLKVCSLAVLTDVVTHYSLYSVVIFSPDCPECTQYVRYVFSVTPGICAFLGVIAFVLFIPATIQCRPIGM